MSKLQGTLSQRAAGLVVRVGVVIELPMLPERRRSVFQHVTPAGDRALIDDQERHFDVARKAVLGAPSASAAPLAPGIDRAKKRAAGFAVALSESGWSQSLWISKDLEEHGSACEWDSD